MSIKNHITGIKVIIVPPI